jgi:hypothetical protein
MTTLKLFLAVLVCTAISAANTEMPNDAQKKATVNVIEASIVHDLCGLSLDLKKINGDLSTISMKTDDIATDGSPDPQDEKPPLIQAVFCVVPPRA